MLSPFLTMEVLCVSHLTGSRCALQDLAGEDERRYAIVEECFNLLLQKWKEFYQGPVYREDIVAALDRCEASFRGRHGSKDAQYFSVPRPRNFYADPVDG